MSSFFSPFPLETFEHFFFLMAVSEGLNWKSALEAELAGRIMSEYGRIKSKGSCIRSLGLL